MSDEFSTPLRAALTRPDLLLGCDRRFLAVLLPAAFLPVLFGLQQGRLDLIAVGIVGLLVGVGFLRRAATVDPQLPSVWLRSQRYPRSMPAVGRWDCQAQVSVRAVAGAERDATPAGKGIAERLSYESLDGDGSVVRLRSGALLGGLWYEGPDIEGAPAREAASPSTWFGMAANKLGEGWVIQQEVIRREDHSYLPADEGFADAVDALIDDERRHHARHLRTSHALFLLYKRPRTARGRSVSAWRSWLAGSSLRDIAEILRGRSDSAKRAAASEARLEMQTYERGVSEVMAALDRGGIASRWMGVTSDNHELLQGLNYVINGRWHKVRTPTNGWYIDVLLARDLLRDPSLQHEDKHVRVVTPLAFPSSSKPSMLEGLCRLGVELRWSTRLICQDVHASKRLLKRIREEWRKKSKGKFLQFNKTEKVDAMKDIDALHRMGEADSAMADIESGAAGLGHLTQAVVVTSTNREDCDEAAGRVRKTFELAGFGAAIERHNDVEALFGSWPGHPEHNCRRPIVNTLNFGDLVSVSREWEGSTRCPFKSWGRSPWMQGTARTGSPFNINLHSQDLGHALVIGQSGSGKSTLLAMLLSQFRRYRGSQVFAFDVGGSLEPLARARSKSAHYSLGASDGPRLCPLGEISTLEEQAWAETWITSLFVDLGLHPDEEERRAIRSAVRDLASSTTSAEQRTLSDFWVHLQSNRLKSAFEYYTQGPGARVLNGNSTNLSQARFVVFELQQLLNGPAQVTGPVVRYVLRWVDRRLDGRPSVIAMEEAWKPMGNPELVEATEEWLRTLRKKGCSLILVTQTPQEILDGPLAAPILSSCRTRIFCPSADAAEEKIRSRYEEMGLRSSLIDQIVHMTPKQDYLWVQGTRSRQFLLDLGPVSLAFCGSSYPDDLRQIRELAARHGRWWPREWLRQKGLREEARRWEQAMVTTRELAGGPA